MKFKRIRNKEFLLELCFYLFVFLMILGFIFLQPFGEGPDESNRYKVTEYMQLILIFQTSYFVVFLMLSPRDYIFGVILLLYFYSYFIYVLVAVKLLKRLF